MTEKRIILEKEVFIKQPAQPGERGVNPDVPFNDGDVVAYLSKNGDVENIILLDCITPFSNDRFDIYYKAMITVNPRQFDTNSGRVWHVGHGLRIATYEETKLLIEEIWERNC